MYCLLQMWFYTVFENNDILEIVRNFCKFEQNFKVMFQTKIC